MEIDLEKKIIKTENKNVGFSTYFFQKTYIFILTDVGRASDVPALYILSK